MYTGPLSAVNGLSRLTTTSNGQARPIRKFSNRPITFEWNRIESERSIRIRIEYQSFAGPYWTHALPAIKDDDDDDDDDDVDDGDDGVYAALRWCLSHVTWPPSLT